MMWLALQSGRGRPTVLPCDIRPALGAGPPDQSGFAALAASIAQHMAQ